jgi:hypothetical protein
MDQMIETAKTQADHEALATHYEQEAKMLQKKAEEHRHMARVYGVLPYGAPKSAINFAQHCNAVASQLEAAAEENLELAKMHRQIAAEAPG